MEIDKDDREALFREKPDATEADLERLRQGEPLAYVIGNQPFLGLTVNLTSRPLIPRPETEWWTELLIERIGTAPVRVLDLCAGSGAIGLAVLKHCPNAHVSFGEISAAHTKQIEENITLNRLDAARADIRSGDLFEPFAGERFDFIAANPPYIPERRPLDTNVTEYEPAEALFAGEDGLSVIRRIAAEAAAYLRPTGEVWIECDIDNIEAAASLFPHSTIHTDPYGRPRLLVAYY